MAEEQWEKQESKRDMWLAIEVGDSLIGTVVEIVDGQFGSQYLIDDGKEIYRTPSHKVLQNRLADIKVGDTVKIVFTGTEAPSVKGQQPTKMYDVFKKA